MDYKVKYIKGSIIPLEEDKEYEFKMHMNLCDEELPTWLQSLDCKRKRRTKRAISRFECVRTYLLIDTPHFESVKCTCMSTITGT